MADLPGPRLVVLVRQAQGPGKRAKAHAPAFDDLVRRNFTTDAPNHKWVAEIERHEAFSNPAVVKGHRLRLVAAGRVKMRAA